MKYERIEENRERGDISLWIIPYGNLMTILMIFFLVLYAFTFVVGGKRYEEVIISIQEEVGGEVSKEEIERMLKREKEEEAINKMEILLEKKGLQKFSNVKIDKQGIKIIFANPILFDSGKAELKSKGKSILREVVQAIKDLDNEITVEGYTDNIPIRSRKFPSNWELSAARAFSVVKQIIQEGIPPERLSARGYGEYRPLYPNDTKEHRALNRRIEINILWTQ